MLCDMFGMIGGADEYECNHHWGCLPKHNVVSSIIYISLREWVVHDPLVDWEGATNGTFWEAGNCC